MPRRLAAGAIVVLCLTGIAMAAQRGWADLTTIPARHAMAAWETQGALADQGAWEVVRARMQRARGLDPMNADHAFDLGRLYEWQALTQPPWTDHARTHRGEAIDQFRETTGLRPSWGYAWAHLAVSKVLNQQFDDEAVAALEKALVLGPWEAGTQRKALWLGMSLWPQLPPELQDKLQLSLRRGLQIQPRAVIDLAIEGGWHNRVEPLLEREGDKEYLERVLRRTAHRSP